jgi:putative ABC transport system permease protein
MALLPGQDRARVFAALKAGEACLVSEPFANKHGVRAGDTIDLRFARLHVAGIYYDYSNERGWVIVDRKTLLRLLPDPAVSNLAVYLEPETGIEEGRKAVEEAVAGHRVLVFSNAALRQNALAVFDRTFAVTWALEAVAILVAVLGVAGALVSMVLDRRRELGLLRFLGAAAPQIRLLVLCEAGLLGLLANAIGLALGYLLSLLLIRVINVQSFGWTIQFHWPVALLVSALTVLYLASVAAGVYPARIAARLNPIEVIHEE